MRSIHSYFYQLPTSRVLIKCALVTRIFLDRRDMSDELRRVFDSFEGSTEAAAECSPPLDVIEAPDHVEVLIDLPGVDAASIQVAIARGVVVVAGTKAPPACAHDNAAFHLAERSFGRFARAVRLNGAFDAGKTEARLAAGELRVVIPRLEERRGREFRIQVRTD
jgi:HSP20 family protein